MPNIHQAPGNWWVKFVVYNAACWSWIAYAGGHHRRRECKHIKNSKKNSLVRWLKRVIAKLLIIFGNVSSWSISALCGCSSITVGWRDWLLLHSQSDYGSVAPDCDCIKAGNEPLLLRSAGRRRSPQIGSRWAAASWGWRHSRPPAEELQGACKDQRRFDPNLTAIKTSKLSVGLSVVVKKPMFPQIQPQC